MYIFEQVFIYLLAAVIAVPLAKRLGLGSLLGYLIAGILIGPLIGIVTDDLNGVKHFAEFGIIMMLFIVGLEIKPVALWQMRKDLTGLGGMQILLTAVIFSVIAFLFNFKINQAITIGLILALSSTAIVLQMLQEKKWLKTRAGKSALSVLLAQDIAVIPMFAILPLLSFSTVSQVQNGHYLFVNLPGWFQALSIILVIGIIIIAGRFLLQPIFRYIVKLRMVEIFTAFILLLIVGITLLLKLIGLSPALGAFLAGVVLSDSDYRSEIQKQIIPFKGMLMGLFFISIGASINFMLLKDVIGFVILWAFILVMIKLLVLMFLALMFKLKSNDFWLFSLSLAQGSEFGFVLFAFAAESYILTEKTAATFILVITLSMMITPILLIIFQKIFKSKPLGKVQYITKNNPKPKIVIAGIGRFGQVIMRLLNANEYSTVVIDRDQTLIDKVNQYQIQGVLGDALSKETLTAINLDQAKIFIAALNDRDAQIDLVKLVKKNYPYLQVVARAYDHRHVYELEEAGANIAVRETFDSALEAGKEILLMLNEKKDRAKLRISLFKAHDHRLLDELKLNWGLKESQDYLDDSQDQYIDFEKIIKRDNKHR